MFTKTKQVIVVFSSGALLLAAAGCTGNAVPAEPTSSSSISTATATGSSSVPPTPSSPTTKPTLKPIPASSEGPGKNLPVPEMPALASEKSVGGLKAFVAHYYDLLEYTLESNDSKPVRAVTDSGCAACFEQFIDTADGNKIAGSWISGADFGPVVTRAVIEGKGGVALLTVSQGEMLVYASDGTRYASFPASTKPLPGSMFLIYAAGWKVQSIEIEEEP
ncbi:DUF6318 family protein [Paeniglutamicibacter sp. ZC-3]|uniref:DUF6318 family protein n=1 Tax=Paeniglutamicibacter sp. ZC-3 TaxID=2986919 RepID=UPI0021F7F059|nr:DUF6318 family protein [Paeniglutamicibacter sp. ZC-3]MCV9995678.1 DUF6318 family protein [Paeniglutamicibacter sp. ZC-3]